MYSGTASYVLQLRYHILFAIPTAPALSKTAERTHFTGTEEHIRSAAGKSAADPEDEA